MCLPLFCQFFPPVLVDEAEELCDRIAILNNGKIIAQGTPKELCESIGKYAVEVLKNGEKEYYYFSDINEAKTFRDSQPDDVQVTSRNTNLEDVFLELTGRENVQATQEVEYRI